MARFDYVVIGAGVMGSATARALARGGRTTLLLEQFQVGHTRGSSHGQARIFRFSYRDAQYVAMAQEALELWRELELESGKKLIRTTGGLDMGKGIEQNAAALDECGATYYMFDAAVMARRFPAIRVPEGQPVLFSPDSGVTAAYDAVRAFVASARSHGAALKEGIRVHGLEPRDGSVTIATGDGPIEAGTVVVTAGGWARSLLATAGIDLPVRPTRETVAYFRLEVPVPTVVDWGQPTAYALPDPTLGLKAGEHIAGPLTDPDEEGQPNEDSVTKIAGWVAEHYPDADPKPHFMETCIYTNTDDERFILERHGPIVIGSPCSGHGFKFAPLIGKRLAALTTEG